MADAVAQVKQHYTFALYFVGTLAGINFLVQASSAAWANLGARSRTHCKSGKDPVRFPWLFQSNCKGLCRPGYRPVYCRTKNSSVPSKRALCCAQRGCRRAPVYRPPDGAPDRATAPEDGTAPCPGRTSVWFEASAQLSMPTEPPEVV